MRFFCLLLLLASCSRTPKDTPTHFHGTSMTIPYRITVGKVLSTREKKLISQTISDTFSEIDATFNNWNPDSEISRFNAAPADMPLPLSPKVATLLQFCKQIVDLSGGRFDPTVGPLVHIWRESLKEKKSPTTDDLQIACDASGWKHLQLSQTDLVKDHPNTSLDLCGVAKGLAVDWITERLQKLGYPNILVEWGHEIRASGTGPNNQLWHVQVDPGLTAAGRPIAPIPLKNLAIATSGDGTQKAWTLSATESPDGQIHRFFPLIDPLTAAPLERTPYSVACVSVIAPTCALADALATAAMLFTSKKEVENWAQEVTTLYPEVSFWILAYDPTRKTCP